MATAAGVVRMTASEVVGGAVSRTLFPLRTARFE